MPLVLFALQVTNKNPFLGRGQRNIFNQTTIYTSI